LVARVKAVLRRAQSEQPVRRLLRLGQLEIDREGREAHIAGEELELRTKEFDLLLTFAEHPGLVFNRDQLLERVWGYSFGGGTRTVDVHIARLRDKLQNSGVRIETIWNVGYKLIEE
jgi:DNA-binding response OmpR family regulator